MARQALLIAFIAGAPAATAAASDVKREQCGKYSLSLAANYLNGEHGQEVWDQLLPSDRAPFSLADLESAARQAGLDTLLVQWADPSAADLRDVCILHVKASESSVQPDHFVTCFGTDRSAVLLGDYPNTPSWVSRDKLRRYWSGTALYIGRPGDLARLRWQMRWAAARRPLGVLVMVVAAVGLCYALTRASRRGLQRRDHERAAESPP
jgi:ABC-type bacteriocin/lantibiotic exporter with double-glycine peptidase domain